MSVAALIVAAGRGSRLSAGRPKQYLPLAGKSVLARTVEAFAGHPDVDQIQVVSHPDDQALYAEAVGGLDLPDTVAGGATRQDSVRLGLEHLSRSTPDKVLIHDAARPFAAADLISRVIAALDGNAGAIAAVALVDTLKSASDNNFIAGTVDRRNLWRAQTPQGFRFGDILAAHRAAAGRNLTDDAAVAEAAGLAVQLVAGSEDNFKITDNDDYLRAQAMMFNALGDIRTGHGIDAHRFAGTAPESGAITLCGVDVAHDKALSGHSDADVGLHALTDALLAAIADHDIGHHFPPNDEKWRGVSSTQFVSFAAGRIADRGGLIAHVDVTLICERPKIGPHRETMRGRITDILGLDPDRVSVKATTTEKMGFTGRGEGIAAQATATVRLPF